MNCWLVTFDITGIQKYIFNSKRLKFCIEGSDLVKKSLEEYLLKSGDKYFNSIWTKMSSKEFFHSKNDDDATIIFSSGGNAQVLCREKTRAEAFVMDHLRFLMEKVPDLNLVADIQEWNPDVESFAHAHKRVAESINQKKNAKVYLNFPELPATVSRCQLTGKPGFTEYCDHSKNIWVSRDIHLRSKSGKEANEWRLMSDLSEKTRDIVKERNLGFSVELDSIRGMEGENSYIGVIHIDGNRMATKFRNLLKDEQSKLESVEKYQTSSQRVDEAARGAFNFGIDWILNNLQDRPNNNDRQSLTVKSRNTKLWAFGHVPLHIEDGKSIIPVRKIIIGGDDITVVAEGSISIDLAAVMTREFVSRLREIKGFEEAGACVGIGLGKAHAPIYRMYHFAEMCCKNAKSQVNSDDSSQIYMDFRFLEESDEKIKSSPGCRPFALPGFDAKKTYGPLPDWYTFRSGILSKFQGDEGKKIHSRLKSFLSDLREGKEMAELKRKIWKERDVKEGDLFSTTNGNLFIMDRSPYIDAIELMDFVVPEISLPNQQEGGN